MTNAPLAAPQRLRSAERVRHDLKLRVLTVVRTEQLTPHMRRITLENIRDALRDMRHEILLPQAVIAPARRALERMLAVGRG